MIKTLSPLFNNQIEVHRPRLKYKEDLSKAPPKESGTFLVRNPLIRSSTIVEGISPDAVEPVGATLEKRYRQSEDAPKTKLGFDNVNVVVPGRFNLTPRPDGVTQCKKDSSTNGKRVCSTQLRNNCLGGFKVGGNCNNQQRLDSSRLPPSEFQMGTEQGGGAVDTRFVPFGPQQTNMAMMATPRTTTTRPLQVNYQLDNALNSFIRLSTRPTPRTTTTRPTPSTTTLSPRQQMVDHVMHMDPPELVDALMEPMMMVVGTMVALSGAYMAIVIDELAASNALALAAAGLGGKRKKK